MKRAVIIHCWEGYPEYCWYPWVKKELEAEGFQVEVPAFPDTDNPKLDAWLPKLQEVAGQPDEDLYLIGHSLGCIAIMRYLETLEENRKIGGVVFVAGFTENVGFEEIQTFFETPVDLDKVKNHVKNGFVAIHSDNDPYVDLKFADVFKEKLNAEIIVKHDAKHFSGAIEGEQSCTELPDVVESIEKLMIKIKAILLDADGLLLKKQRYFSEIFSEKYNVPIESVIPFFKTKFRDCQRGVLDIKEELLPFLREWNWSGSVQDFLDFWFMSSTEIDSEALDIVRDLRRKGSRCYLVTDQEKYRGEYIKRNLGLENQLDGFFYSYELGCSKSDKGFFEAILERLALEPDEVAFFDDEKENVEIAKRVGISSMLVTKIDDFAEAVSRKNL